MYANENGRLNMDSQTAARVAKLARLEFTADGLERMTRELSSIFGWLDELNKVDVDGVEPISHPFPLDMPLREDVVTDGNVAEDLAGCAPKFFCGYYVTPKVIE